MTDCPHCKAIGVDHDDIVQKCLSSPYYTGLYLCGFDLFQNSFHKTLADWFISKLNQGKRRFIIMTPRNHLKTSMFGVALMVWRAIVNPEDRLLYVMASCTESEKTLLVARDVLAYSENVEHYFPLRTLDFGNPMHTGTKEKVKLARTGNYREATLEARGIDSRKTGGHFTWHVFDDLIDETMVKSVALQNDVISFIKNSDALFFEQDRDVEIIIGTMWAGPFYKWLLNDSGIADDYEKAIIGCFVDKRYEDFLADIGKKTTLQIGDPVWPEHFSKETLNQIARKAGPADFSRQWLNIALTDEDVRFHEEDFQFYSIAADRESIIIDEDGVTRNIPYSRLYRSMTIDPATGEGNNTDESAITITGYDRVTGKIFVLDAWDRKSLPHALIDQILRMAEQWKPHVIAPEDVSFQKTLKHFLMEEMNRRGLYFPIRPVKPGSKSKGVRIIDSLQPFIANRQMYLGRSRQHRRIIDEAVELQVVDGKVVGRSPNLLDSLAYHEQFWRGQLVEKENKERRENRGFRSQHQPSYGLMCVT